MIYTLTTNPAIDMNITSDKLLGGKVNRTDNAVYSPNGKGLNVSFVLKHFGVESVILGFFGGFSGEYIIDECIKRGYMIDPVKINGTTRINIFVQVGNEEYKLVNSGPDVNPDKQKQLFEKLEFLPDIDILTINGSLANCMSGDFYDSVFEICNRRKIKVIPDISSPKLKDLLKHHPFLIKPNNDELREIFGIAAEEKQETINSLRQLHAMGAQNILLTCGDKGAYFYNGDDIYFCNTYPVRQKSSACAGDGFLGAFLSIWLKNPGDIEQALKLAAATGANIAESDGIGDLSNVSKYAEKISVTKIPV